MKRVRSALLVAAGLVIASVTTASAAPTSRVLTSADCGTTIDTNVTLRADLDCRGVDLVSLTVGADKITITLNGYTLTGPPGKTAISTDGHNGVTVKSGTIAVTGNVHAIDTDFSPVVTVSAVKFVNDSGTNHYGTGVYAEHTGKLNVSGSTSDDFQYGIVSYFSSIYVTSSAFNNGYQGVYSYKDTVDSITGSKALNNEYGFNLRYAALVKISNTAADGNVVNGFYLYPGEWGVVQVSGSFARSNGDDGFYVYESYSYYGGSSGLTNSFTNNVSSDNGGFGFYFDFPSVTTFSGNIANGNDKSGVYVDDNYGLYGAFSASNNTARYNGNGDDYGFYGAYAVTGSGNKAYGNNNTNCYSWVCTVVKR